MTSSLPRGLKTERRKAILHKRLEELFEGVNVQEHLFECVATAVAVAELELFSRRGHMGSHKKDAVLSYFIGKVQTLDRVMVGKMIDSLASKVHAPTLIQRFMRFAKRFF